MPSLEQSIRDTMARLSVLSEAQASTLEPRTSGSKTLSKPPAGVSIGAALLSADPERPPRKDRSLYDWYRWQFEHTDPDDNERLLKLWLAAERDYHTRCLNLGEGRRGSLELAHRRVAIRSGTHLEKDDEDEADAPAWPAPLPNKRYRQEVNRGADDEKEAARQVVELYEGQSAEEAAVFENVPIEVIHKARRMFKRNLDDGRPRPPFLDWDDEERRRQINLLRQRAKAQDRTIGAKSIADHFGVSKQTIQRYLDPERAAA